MGEVRLLGDGAGKHVEDGGDAEEGDGEGADTFLLNDCSRRSDGPPNVAS